MKAALASQVLRWAVSAALLAFGLSKLTVDQIVAITNSQSLKLLGVASLTLLFIVALNVVRWLLIARIIALQISWLPAVQWVLIGHFFNQFLPSSVGGDVMRGYLAGRGTGNFPAAISSIALDRFVGLLALLLIIATSLWQIERLGDAHLYELAMGALGFGFCALAAIFVLDKMLVRYFSLRFQRVLFRVSRDARQLVAQPSLSISALLISLVMQIINFSLVAFIANRLGASISMSEALLTIPTVMLIASLPISIGGWGLRETGLAVAFTIVGQSPSIAVATSVLFGLANLISALPGAVAWGLALPARHTSKDPARLHGPT